MKAAKMILAVMGFATLSGCAQANTPGAGAADATPVASAAAARPAPSTSVVERALAASGIRITGNLDAPKGFHGFVGSYQGQVMPVYVTPDGTHLLVGTLFDLEGHDLTSPAIGKATAADGAQLWKTLSGASTIVAGNPDAKRIVYAFMDTDCPFCHQFWQASQSWLKSGDVQMRIVLVAVISRDSVPRGGAVLDAKDPEAAWAANEREFGPKRPPVNAKPSAAALRTLGANNQLMQQFGFQGTPTIVYKDTEGRVQVLQGMPRDSKVLKYIFTG